MELLTPTLTKIITNQLLLILLEEANHEKSSQNNWSTLHAELPHIGRLFRKIFFTAIQKDS